MLKFCMMENPPFELSLLGPLYPLVGRWQGSAGRNIAPDPDRGIEDGAYTEELSFTPIKIVKNHEQTLYGLRYQTVGFENGAPFHEEVGYWLWEPEAKEVYRCFVVPRGITVLAGGKVGPEAKSFALEAKLGDPCFGISSIPFLDREFQTVRYTLEVSYPAPNQFFYKEITFMKMPGREKLFEHLDQNLMVKIN